MFTWKVLRGLNLDLNLESVAGFKFGLKLNLNWKVSLKCMFSFVYSIGRNCHSNFKAESRVTHSTQMEF